MQDKWPKIYVEIAMAGTFLLGVFWIVAAVCSDSIRDRLASAGDAVAVAAALAATLTAVVALRQLDLQRVAMLELRSGILHERQLERLSTLRDLYADWISAAISCADSLSHESLSEHPRQQVAAVQALQWRIVLRDTSAERVLRVKLATDALFSPYNRPLGELGLCVEENERLIARLIADVNAAAPEAGAASDDEEEWGDIEALQHQMTLVVNTTGILLRASLDAETRSIEALVVPPSTLQSEQSRSPCCDGCVARRQSSAVRRET